MGVSGEGDVFAGRVSYEEVPRVGVGYLESVVLDVVGESQVFGRLEIAGEGFVSTEVELVCYDGGGFTGDENSHELRVWAGASVDNRNFREK